MNDQENSERKSSRREKFSKKKDRRRDFSDDYQAYKGLRRDFKNKKREIEDEETWEDLDEYQ